MKEYSVLATIVKRSAGISAPVSVLRQVILGDEADSLFWSKLILAYAKQFNIVIADDIKDEINLMTIEKYKYIFRLSPSKLILDYRRVKNSHHFPKSKFSNRMHLIEDLYYPLGIEPRLLACCFQLLQNKIENNTNSNYYELIKALVGERNFEQYSKQKINTALSDYFFGERTQEGYSKKLFTLFSAIRSVELQQIISQKLTVKQEDKVFNEMISRIARANFKKFFKKFNLVSDEDVEIINDVMIQFNPICANVMRSFFGINGPAISLQELADRDGRTRERIRQIKDKSLIVLKQAEQIRDIMEKYRINDLQ